MNGLRKKIRTILKEYWSADEYPEFTDGQFNPLFKNRPYLPTMNMNTAPLSEDENIPEQLEKRQLPIEYDYMWGDYIKSLGDSVTQIMPNIGLEAIQNTNTKDLVRVLAEKYPELYDEFAEWIYKQLHGQISEAEISYEEINKKDLPYKFPELFDDFIQSKTEAEIREVAPTIDLRQEPEDLMVDMDKNYPSLFDNFADWLFNREQNQTTFK